MERERTELSFLSLGIKELVLVGRYDCRRTQPPLIPHLHPGIFEVVVLDHGSQTYFVGAERYEIKGNDVFLTRPDEIHSTGNEPQSRSRLYWFQFKPAGKGRSFLGLKPRESQSLLERFRHLPARHFHNATLLIPTLERIFTAYADGANPLRAAELRNLLLRLVLDTISIAEQRIDTRFSPGIQRAIQHIENNRDTPSSLQELARTAGMSESHFKAAFSRATGMPPVQYALCRRIARARTLLQTSSEPITKIAVSNGFATSQHFATVFKRMTGLTPNSFRKRGLENVSPESIHRGYGPNYHARLTRF